MVTEHRVRNRYSGKDKWYMDVAHDWVLDKGLAGLPISCVVLTYSPDFFNS